MTQILLHRKTFHSTLLHRQSNPLSTFPSSSFHNSSKLFHVHDFFFILKSFEKNSIQHALHPQKEEKNHRRRNLIKKLLIKFFSARGSKILFLFIFVFGVFFDENSTVRQNRFEWERKKGNFGPLVVFLVILRVLFCGTLWQAQIFVLEKLNSEWTWKVQRRLEENN
jgi:hypothetical protein